MRLQTHKVYPAALYYEALTSISRNVSVLFVPVPVHEQFETHEDWNDLKQSQVNEGD